MKKIIQIMPANGEYEAVFFSYDTGDLFTEPLLCWALISENPCAEDDDEPEEKRYIEGQVIFKNGCSITGCCTTPYARKGSFLPKKSRIQRLFYTKDRPGHDCAESR